MTKNLDMKLRLVGPESQVVELGIGTEPRTIGRAAGCDLVIADQTISRQHLTVWLDDDGRVIVRDESRYGTQISGEHVVDEDVVLRVGEEIEVGCYAGSVVDGNAPDISTLPTVDMEMTSLQTPASTRKTRLLKTQKRRSNGYLVLLFALAALGGVMLAYILMDAF